MVTRTDFYQVTESVPRYMDVLGKAPEASKLYVGSELFAAVRGDETRMLNGRLASVIVLSVGADGKGLYYLPRTVFRSCTVWFDPKKRTGVPFQN